MSRMARKQVYIEPEQRKLLKQRARELGVTESEVIRRGIKQELRTSTGTAVDSKAWEEARQFILQRMALSVPQTSRDWTRNDLHEGP